MYQKRYIISMYHKRYKAPCATKSVKKQGTICRVNRQASPADEIDWGTGKTENRGGLLS